MPLLSEVKDEYISRYLEGNIGKATIAEVENNRPVIKEDVAEDTGPLAPSVIARLPPLDASPQEAKLLNYMFLRDDYEAVINVFIWNFFITTQMHF